MSHGRLAVHIGRNTITPTFRGWLIHDVSGRSAPRAEAAGAHAGPHADPGRWAAETARIVAGPAVVVPGLGVAGLGVPVAGLGVPTLLIAATIVTAATRGVAALARTVVACAAVVARRLVVALVAGPAAPVARLRRCRPQNDEHRCDQQTYL